MSAFNEMPFNGVSNEDLKVIFPKEGDDYEGHTYSKGCWYMYTIRTDDHFHKKYVDERGNWHDIDYETQDA